MNTRKIRKKKSTKSMKLVKFKKCIAILSSNHNNICGEVQFTQKKNYLLISYNIKNLKNGLHGFHVHQCGDLSKGCTSGCSHFNPFNKTHGGLNDVNSHAGDLGNIHSKNKICKGTIKTNKISLNNNKKNIIGRMIIVHEDADDCGMGNDKESMKTGNAGHRLACGIIGVLNF